MCMGVVCIRVRVRILKYATWRIFFNMDGTMESPQTQIQRYGVRAYIFTDPDLDTYTNTEEWRYSFTENCL